MIDLAAALLASVDNGTFGGPQSGETMDGLSVEASRGTLSPWWASAAG
jgi:hypothetical protein